MISVYLVWFFFRVAQFPETVFTWSCGFVVRFRERGANMKLLLRDLDVQP